LTVKGCGFQPK